MARYESRWRDEDRINRWEEPRERWRAEDWGAPYSRESVGSRRDEDDDRHRGRGDYDRGDYGGYGPDERRAGGGYGRSSGWADYGGAGRGYSGRGYGDRGYWGAGGSAGYAADMGREDYGRYRGDYGGGYGREGYAVGYSGGGYGGRDPDDRGFLERAGDQVASWFGDEEPERHRRTEEMRAGQHRGRGPRGYTRSDARIQEDVNDRLTDDFWIDASDVEVSVSGGEVTLNGMVNNRGEKRRAEDIADDISGVKHVQNNLRIREHQGVLESRAAGTTAGSTAGATGATSTTGTTGRAASRRG